MIINPYQFGVAIDPDAQAFLTATAITDATITSAINQLVIDLKFGPGLFTFESPMTLLLNKKISLNENIC